MSELATEISHITGIDIDYLKISNTALNACAAVKMSWMSKGQTGRIEDMAYCLLGMFNVNMPLLYGEGKKGFFRLQLEIIKQSEDESLFAWSSVYGPESWSSGLFAPRPSCFADSGTIERLIAD